MEGKLEDKIFINSIVGTLISLGIEKLNDLAVDSNHNKIMLPSVSHPVDILTYHKKEEFISCSYKVGKGAGSLEDGNGAFFDPKDIETREIGISLHQEEILAMLKDILGK